MLEQGALALGELWTQLTCDELRAQGRRIVGGWPGTLSEARARVLTYCEAELRRQRMTPLTAAEREELARSTYAHARRAWLSLAARGGARGISEPPEAEPG